MQITHLSVSAPTFELFFLLFLIALQVVTAAGAAAEPDGLPLTRQ
jgi:hypothetical protein